MSRGDKGSCLFRISKAMSTAWPQARSRLNRPTQPGPAMNTSPAVTVDLTYVLGRSCDGLFEGVFSDPSVAYDLSQAQARALVRAADMPYPCERLNPESIGSYKKVTCDLLVAMFHLPYERFDELVGRPGENFAILPRSVKGGVSFDIEKLESGAEPREGWLKVAPVAASGDDIIFGVDVRDTINSNDFANQHRAIMLEKQRRDHELANAERRAAGEPETPFAPVAKDLTLPAPMDAEEARDCARFTLSRLWAMNHDDQFLSHAFKSVHGMSLQAAAKIATEAAQNILPDSEHCW